MSEDADDPSTNKTHEPICGSSETPSGRECHIPVADPDEHCFVHSVDDDDTPTLKSTVARRLDLFADAQPIDRALFADYYVDYQEKAENDTEAARLAGLAVLCDSLEATLIREGLTVSDPETDQPRPRQQLLRAYTDLLRELRLKLNHEGVSNNDNTVTHYPGKQLLWEGSDDDNADDNWSE